MSKAAATKKVTTSADGDMQPLFDAVQAKNRFFSASLGMGWRMAITVVIPIIIGVKVDEHFHSTPSYTLAAFMIAVCGAVAVVWSSVKEVNAETAELTATQLERENSLKSNNLKKVNDIPHVD